MTDDSTQAQLREMVSHIARTITDPPLGVRDHYGEFVEIKDGEVAEDGMRYYFDDDEDVWRCHDPEDPMNPDEDDEVEVTTMDAMAYLDDALDFEFIVASDCTTLLGARICVGFGGPSLWIDTRHNRVEGYWWSDRATESFADNMGLFEFVEEMWQSR